MQIYLPFRIPTKAQDQDQAKAEVLFSPPGLFTKISEGDGLLFEEICS